MTISEKAAYLKGLVEGLGADKDSRDGKLWTCVTDLLSDLAHEIDELQDQGQDFADTLDEFGDELSYLEEITCDLDTPDDMFDDECDGNCEECGLCDYDEDDDIGDVVAFSDYADAEEEETDAPEDELPADELPEDEAADDDDELEYDGVVYDVTCPTCGEEISFDEETLQKGSITCPKCGEVLEFDLDDGEAPF